MCQYKSGIAIRRGDGIDLLTLADDDSHIAIRQKFNIREESGGLGDSHQTPVEFVPEGALADIASYRLVYDAGRPEWLTNAMAESLIGQFQRRVQRELDAGLIQRRGYLDLSSLTSLPPGVTLEAGDNLYLSSLTSLPPGVTLKAGSDLNLSSLTSLPPDVTLKAGGNLYLNSLTSLPPGVTLEAGSNLYLGSLTSLPPGVTLKAGSNLYLGSLTSLPPGVTLEAGGYLDLNSLTSLPESVTLKARSVYYDAKWQPLTLQGDGE